jgi:uncharacterized surface protein with fasciclin (FAS1) repeats
MFLLPCLLSAAMLSLAACASSDIAATPANVVVAANANPELSTFSKLIKQAGLEGSLEGATPVTVFAPSDDAFKALPAATLDKLSKDPAQLKTVLGYHVVPGVKKIADFDGSQPVTTSTGAKMTVSKAGDFLTVDDGMVIKADQSAGNGVIHVIDRVLTPPKP